MTIRILLNLLTVCGLMMTSCAYAQTVTVPPDTKQLALGPYLEYLEDAAATYQIDNLTQPGSRLSWQRSNQKILNFGYTDSVYWTRVSLSQSGTQRSEERRVGKE